MTIALTWAANAAHNVSSAQLQGWEVLAGTVGLEWEVQVDGLCV